MLVTMNGIYFDEECEYDPNDPLLKQIAERSHDIDFMRKLGERIDSPVLGD